MVGTYRIIAVNEFRILLDKTYNLLLFFSSSLENALVDVDGKLLCTLHKMKRSSPDSYYKCLDKHFDRIQGAQMRDTLKFDYELECLFQ